MLVLIVATIFSCNNDDPASPEYRIGKNRFTLQIDGDTREFYVHVPELYDPNQQTPVVFMLHGTSGDGEKFYDISGWKEVGEVENILTVFPSSWHYCIIDDGQVLNTTKWHGFPAEFQFCNTETPRDDVGFLRAIIAELHTRFNVDAKRIYMAGFSNGGQMAGRCAVEMGDVLAAVCENAGTLPIDTTCSPVRNLPVMFMFGNRDDRFTGDPNVEIPMANFEMMLDSSVYINGVVNSHLNSFGIQDNYTVSGTEGTRLTASYPISPSSPEHIFLLTLVNGLTHVYPNGTNHWMFGAEVQWAWMSQFTLP